MRVLVAPDSGCTFLYVVLNELKKGLESWPEINDRHVVKDLRVCKLGT